MIIFRIVLIIFSVLCFNLSLCIAGGDLYVSTTGTDNGTCGTSGSPCRTIQYTISNRITDASGGWNIILRGGTYQEHDITIAATKTGTSGAWNTLRSYAGEWAIIDGQRLNTGNTRGLIENLDGFYHSEPASYAKYWTFERLELKGGGTTDSGEQAGTAIWWVKGPFKVRYCYIHDNLTNTADGNSNGIGGPAWTGCTIEYNYFDHNGSELHGASGDSGGCNSCSGPNPEAQYTYTSVQDGSFDVQQNEIRYNYIKTYGDTGIRTKADSRLTATRNGTETSQINKGDKIHHNIIQSNRTGDVCSGIFYQQDYVQIYKNIVDFGTATSTAAAESWGISSRRVRTAGVDVLKPTIYNNTIINPQGDAIHDAHDNEDTSPYFYAYNNIIDNPGYDPVGGTRTIWAPMIYGCSAGYCPEYATHNALSTTNVKFDRNYLYRATFDYAVYIGNASWPTGGYSVSGWETAKSANLYNQAYDAGNLLFVGTSGADKYRVRSAHTVEGSTTIANGGIGGSHPYLTGVTFPSYIGAADPSDDSWVAGVLALNSTYFTSAVDGSTPSWVEGGSGDTTAPTTAISTSDPSSTTSDSFSVTGTASDAVGVTEVT